MMGSQDKYAMAKKYKRFLQDLRHVEEMAPKEHWLYPVLKGVPFSDFHTALQMAIERYRNEANDNRSADESDA